MNGRLHAVFFALATLVVALAVGWGFWLVGSPETRRLERIDRQRLDDLQAIVREIEELVLDHSQPRKLKAPLPQTLEAVAQGARRQKIRLHDPDTGQPYRYTVKGDSTFELCATFYLARDSDYSVFWNHPAGEHCFTIDVLDLPPLY